MVKLVIPPLLQDVKLKYIYGQHVHSNLITKILLLFTFILHKDYGSQITIDLRYTFKDLRSFKFSL